MAINILHLDKYYGSQHVLHDVSIRFPENAITGLLGPNGAGKSTLMNCIMNIIDYRNGEILIDGKPTVDCKNNLGFLAENNPLYLDMYVVEYLTFVCNIYKISTKTIDDTIEKVGLTPEKHKKLRQLSKGYKQRVGLAQAIIHDPKYLILDEPTNGLDPNQIIEIRKLITELAKDKTVILSTHLMQEVEAMCDQVVLINKGYIVHDSGVEEFKGKYTHLEEAFYALTHS